MSIIREFNTIIVGLTQWLFKNPKLQKINLKTTSWVCSSRDDDDDDEIVSIRAPTLKI